MEADYIEQVSLYRILLDIEIRKVQRFSEELKGARRTIAELEQRQEEIAVDNTDLAAESVLVKDEGDDDSSDLAHELPAARRQIVELKEALAAQGAVHKGATIAGSKRKRFDVDHAENPQRLHERVFKEASRAPSSARSTDSTDEQHHRIIEASQADSSESIEDGAHSGTAEDSTKAHEISEADIRASHSSGLLSILKVSIGPDAEQHEEATALSLSVQKKIVEIERLVEDGAVVEYCRNKMTIKCLRGAINVSGHFFWTKEHPGRYACLTCTNMQLPCIARNQATDTWELLPLAPGLPRQDRAANNGCKYTLAEGRGSKGKFTATTAGRRLRSLWIDNPHTLRSKPSTSTMQSLIRKT
ncbi:hypothetical protein LTR56_003898 [Elasticomyces elasticus]|nr:hypothetical protein LTR22_022573 [Elasticomyces elasticus]KAK3654625.1 hypothetical protein LTR56_003898 [Elasticomyces elasticus]KAK4907995.1 hypothetical protein LTR49_023026 [Elasticomyces elasticus]KAK5755253.1 hypothetical protein LTS12_014703 [Elasticomyces elasticus]